MSIMSQLRQEGRARQAIISAERAAKRLAKERGKRGWQARAASVATFERQALERFERIKALPTRQIIIRDVETLFDMQANTAKNVLVRLEQMGHLVKVRRGVWERVAKSEQGVG